MRKNCLKSSVVFPALAASCLLVTSQCAFSQASLMIDAGPCIALETAVERYTCYEKQSSTALNAGLGGRSASAVRNDVQPSVTRPATTQVAPTAAPAAVPAPSASSRTGAPIPANVTNSAVSNNAKSADEFGLVKKAGKNGETVTELHSVISAVSTPIPNQHLVTLENGQVWRQTRPDPKIRLVVGNEVRIYPTRWGSDYRMSVDALKGFVQVERIQ